MRKVMGVVKYPLAILTLRGHNTKNAGRRRSPRDIDILTLRGHNNGALADAGHHCSTGGHMSLRHVATVSGPGEQRLRSPLVCKISDI
jgi:hypothetical protein